MFVFRNFLYVLHINSIGIVYLYILRTVYKESHTMAHAIWQCANMETKKVFFSTIFKSIYTEETEKHTYIHIYIYIIYTTDYN